MSITLPPLPEPSNYPSAIEMLRARDIEVANMVLKAAAKGCENVGELLRGNATPTPNETAAFIRNLKVSHD